MPRIIVASDALPGRSLRPATAADQHLYRRLRQALDR
jgi:hypothetical protein